MFQQIGDFFRDNAWTILLTTIVSYLLGSINFAILITYWRQRKDIRTMGSGNAGATNVLRSLGWFPALITTVGDVGKAIASVLIGRWIFRALGSASVPLESRLLYGAYIAGLFCLLGHIFPCLFKFKGGKGVLTLAGMIMMIDWRVFLCLLSIFIVVFLISRIVSLASVIGVSFYPMITFLLTYFVDYRTSGSLFSTPLTEFEPVVVATLLSAFIGGIVIWMHRENIKRLKAGTEKKLTLGRAR